MRAFTADQSRRILQAALGYGLAIRLHADELAPSGGAELAAEMGEAAVVEGHEPAEKGAAETVIDFPKVESGLTHAHSCDTGACSTKS